MKRVLAFGCHPDDIEFQIAGTLALLAEAGCEIHMAVMAGGEVGSPTLRPQEIREKRLAENASSAALLGAKFHYAGGHDLEIEYNKTYRKLAVRIMRQVAPDIVLTAPPMDYLIDHEETSRLVRNAAFIAPVPNFDCGVPTTPTTKVPHLYYWSAMGQCDIFGRVVPFSCGVDITSKMDVKRKMLACHESQRQWLAHINGWDEYIDNMANESAAIGKIAGCEYAEGLIQHKGLGYPQDNILREILGEKCTEDMDLSKFGEQNEQ